MAEVIRTVVTRVEVEPTRPEPEPVVMRGVTLVPRYGTPVRVAGSTPMTEVPGPAGPTRQNNLCPAPPALLGHQDRLRATRRRGVYRWRPAPLTARLTGAVLVQVLRA